MFKHRAEGVIDQYDNGDIHQVVGNEYRGQQPFGLGQQLECLAAPGIFFKLLALLGIEREKGNFASGDKSGDAQRHQSNA